MKLIPLFSPTLKANTIQIKDDYILYANSCDSTQAEKSARLIAAAPEMFEALQSIVDRVQDHDLGMGDMHEMIRHVAAVALAKARGES